MSQNSRERRSIKGFYNLSDLMKLMVWFHVFLFWDEEGTEEAKGMILCEAICKSLAVKGQISYCFQVHFAKSAAWGVPAV